MKLDLGLGALPFVLWLALSAAPAPRNEVRVLGERTLEVVQGDARAVLTLDGLPSGARLQAGQAAPLLDSGTVVAVVVQVENGYEYRYLCRRVAGDWGVRSVGDDPSANDGWWLTQPLFVEHGEPYRIADVHNPGGDSIELTLRRGPVTVRGEDVRLDEVLVVDDCPSSGSSGESPWVHVIGVQGRRR